MMPKAAWNPLVCTDGLVPALTGSRTVSDQRSLSSYIGVIANAAC